MSLWPYRWCLQTLHFWVVAHLEILSVIDHREVAEIRVVLLNHDLLVLVLTQVLLLVVFCEVALSLGPHIHALEA